MDQERIDRLARRVAGGLSRRRLASFTGLGVAALVGLPTGAAAKKKKKKVTLCLDGQTIQVPKKKVGKFRQANPGAVPGACQGSCTPTTCTARSIQCGPLADGCGGTLQCGECGEGAFDEILTCVEGICKTCNGRCPADALGCMKTIDDVLICQPAIVCLPGNCERDADCPPDEGGGGWACVDRSINLTTNQEVPVFCNPPAGKGACILVLLDT